jgi:hypothetical protein
VVAHPPASGWAEYLGVATGSIAELPSRIRHFSYADPLPYGADLAILVRLVANGRLHPEIGRVANWADTAATLADLRDRRIRGNAVLTVN